jgi:tetratricopeptide (TPR) repeat protein
MKLTTLIIATLLLTTGTVWGQKGVTDGSKWGHGEDSIRCLTNLSLYTEYFKQRNYKDAFPYWEIAFNECPLSQLSLYSNGTTIIKNFLDKETDAAKKEDLYNYLMKVYDQRIQYFGNNSKYPTPYIQGIKAVDMLKYKKDDIATSKEAYELLKKAIAGRGNQTQPAILINHMTNSVTLFKSQQITAEAVVEAYTTISDILETQTSNIPDDSGDNGNLDEIKQSIEKIFAASGAANCETLQKIFGPQFAANSADLNWLKRVSNLLNKQECEIDLVFSVSESLHKIEPSSNSARGLGRMCLKNKETDKAIEFFKQAIELETNAESKGSDYYTLGIIYMSQDNYGTARSNFNKASELRPGWGLPYIQIGVLYGASAKNCGSNDFERRVAYWAAVDKFMRAKTVDPSIADEANKQIATYSAHFPNKEELFFQGLAEGSSYTVGCWINETTTVRAKK